MNLTRFNKFIFLKLFLFNEIIIKINDLSKETNLHIYIYIYIYIFHNRLNIEQLFENKEKN